MYKKIGLLLLFLILVIVPLLIQESPLYAKVNSYGNLSASDITSDLNWTNVVEYARVLSSYDSRMTGYAGYYDSLDNITNVLASFGLTTQFQNFRVSVPISSGASITVVSSGEALEAFSLQPNLVALSSTPPEGVRGSLVYVGRGGPDFDGESINGSIVLMRMDSQDEWVSAASLGAKAVIFFSLKPITRDEAEYKKLNVPFNFPRVYVEGQVAEKLVDLAHSGNNEVVLKSTVMWKEVEAKNIFVTIPGEINETIVLATHIDASSIVMDRAPGAREAMNIALLLELARIYRDVSPHRKLLIAFLSGYHQNLAGAREFVEENFEKIFPQGEIKLFIGIDLGTEGRRVLLAYAGWNYNYYLAAGGESYGLSASNRFGKLYDTVKQIISEMGKLGENVDNGLTDSPIHGVWEAFMPVPIGFDHEAYNQAGGTGFTVTASKDRREYWKTPDDTLDTMNLDDLQEQVETTVSLINNIQSLGVIPLHAESKPTRYSTTYGAAGFATLTGKVVKYDFRTAWYKVLNKTVLSEEYGPNASILIHIYLSYPARTFPLLFNMLVKPDDNGDFKVYGVPTINTWWSTTRFTAEAAALTVSDLLIEPYIVDQYGHVLAAPDFGRYGSPQRLHQIDRGLYKVDRAAVFDCGSIILFDLLEFQYSDVLKREIINEPSLAPLIWGDIIFDADGHVPTDFQFASAASTSNVLIVYAPPNARIEIIGTSSQYAYPNIVLNRHGLGYSLNRGEQHIYYNSLLETVQNLGIIVEQRLNVTSSFNVHSLLAEPLHTQAKELMATAENFYENKNYSMFKSMTKTAWNYEYLAYIYARQLYNDVINTITFFSTLLVPATLLISALLFGSLTTLKRILANVGVFSVLAAILFFFHPGFHLASSTMMVLAGFVSILLLVPVESILAGLFGDQLKKFRQKMMGLHFAEISRVSAALMAFSMGVENMRKRKLRTLLTLISLSIIVFSLTALTSLPSILTHKTIPVGNESPYTGIMLRHAEWQDLSPNFAETLSKRLEGTATVHPRVWLYPKVIRRGVAVGGEAGVEANFELTSDWNQTFISAILGVTPGDPLIKESAETFLKEGSRWFTPYEEDAQVCLIGESLSEILNVTIEDIVKIEGLEFKVIGFFNEKILRDIRDIDERRVIPINLAKPGEESLDPSLIMIIPYGASLKLDGSPTLIVMEFYNSTVVEDYARRLSLELSLNPYYGIAGGDTKQISVFTSISIVGLQNIIILLVISMFTIVNMMLGIVEERSKEIGILSAVGLSPLHVLFMFLAEITNSAVISAVFGYIVGVVGMSIIQTFNIGPAIVLNYSSNLVIISLGISISSAIAASLIPAIKASKLVTPSLERKWKIPIKPKGTEWTIPLPFSSNPDELSGILVFLEEYVSSHYKEGVGNFISSDTAVEKFTYREVRCPAVKSRIQLPPYDQGLTQEVYIAAILDKTGEKYDFIVHTKRLTGMEGTWKRSNPLFVDGMRKQLLIWRTLREADRKEYIQKGKMKG